MCREAIKYPSQKKRFEKGKYPEGAIQVLAEAGDAVIFPWALWHGVGPNHTDRIPKKRHIPLWADVVPVPTITTNLPADVLARMTPRRRRLFGDMGADHQPTDYFKPHDQIETICADEWNVPLP